MWFRSHFIIFSVFTFNYAKPSPLNILATQPNSQRNTPPETVDYLRVRTAIFVAVRNSPMQPQYGRSNDYPKPSTLNRNQFSSDEQCDDSSVGEGSQFNQHNLETTKKPLSSIRLRGNEKINSAVQFEESYEQDSQQRRPSNGVISYIQESSRKPVQITSTDTTNQRKPSYSEYPDRQITNLYPYPPTNTQNIPSSKPNYSENTRRPPQIIHHSGQNSQQEKPNENIDYSRIPTTYPQQNYQQSALHGNNQNYKPELAHTLDERPLLTPDQKIQVVIDYPTQNYENFDSTTRAPFRRPQRNRKKNQGAAQ